MVCIRRDTPAAFQRFTSGYWQALIPQLTCRSTYNWALRYMPAALVAVTTLGKTIGSTILAYLILGEMPTWIKLRGGHDPGRDLPSLSEVSQPMIPS